VFEDVYDILGRLATKPRQAQIKDLPQAQATNRTVAFSNDDGSVTINGRTLIYRSNYGNKSVDFFRGSVLGRALFKALDQIRWTRGSGGVITYTDEYMRETMDAGAMVNSISNWFGPLGEREYERVRGWNPRTLRVVYRSSLR